ncbi:hypothetical protein Btru_076163 [Bulinus truncatus]|nr:hypothetical protein Btru_076163 [Bulinus truncatus]
MVLNTLGKCSSPKDFAKTTACIKAKNTECFLTYDSTFHYTVAILKSQRQHHEPTTKTTDSRKYKVVYLRTMKMIWYMIYSQTMNL